VASAIWYPVWDAGLKLGHAVRSVDEQIELAKHDLDTATALLTARLIAGDAKLGGQVDRARSGETGGSAASMARGCAQSACASARRRPAMWRTSSSPTVKDGHGGIRDVQSLWWAECGGWPLSAEDDAALNECYDVLLDARVALHRRTGRPGRHAAARETRTRPPRGRSSATPTCSWLASPPPPAQWPGSPTRRGAVVAAEGGTPARSRRASCCSTARSSWPVMPTRRLIPTFVLRVATAAARNRVRIGRRSLDRLAASMPPWPETWPAGAIDKLVALLLEGHKAIPVIEALDQRGLITRMLPAWAPVRSRPQRNAYHRFTVDRPPVGGSRQRFASSSTPSPAPTCSCSAPCSTTSARDTRATTPMSASSWSARSAHGWASSTSTSRCSPQMVRHHLLLPDVRVRRDLADTATIEFVAERSATKRCSTCCTRLTIADSKATGPSAWGSWKEGLVAELVRRVTQLFGGTPVDEVAWTLFPDAETLELMATNQHHVRTYGDARRSSSYRRRAGRLQPHRRRAVAARLDVLSARGPLRRATLGLDQHGRVGVPGPRARAAVRLGAVRRRHVARRARRAGDRGAPAERARTYPPPAADARPLSPARHRVSSSTMGVEPTRP
jgi:[protein-PII] uridylyltransferase